MDSMLILLSSRWPAVRNRTESFHSRCNEPHHPCICRRKELSEWKALQSRTVSPWHFSSVACTGKWSVCSSRGRSSLYRNSDLCLWNSMAPAIGSALSQTTNRGAVRKYQQSRRALSLHSQLPAAVRTDEQVSSLFPLTGFLLIYGWSSPKFPLLSTLIFSLESFLPQPRVFKVHSRSLTLSRECHNEIILRHKF